MNQHNDNKKLVYQQIYNGTPVYDGYFSIHLRKGRPDYCSGKFINHLTVSNKVNIVLEDAINIWRKFCFGFLWKRFGFCIKKCQIGTF